MVTVADLVAYRRRHEKLVERVVDTKLPTAFGDFVAVGYRSLVDNKHHVALVKGEVDGRRGRARARALGVPDRRRLPLAALRLRRAARVGAGDDRAARAAASCSTSARRAAGSACSTSCAPTSSRRRASTPSTPTSASACPPICATTASARRSSSTSGSPASASSPTTPRRSPGWPATGCRSPTRSRSSTLPNPHNEAYLRAKRERLGHTLHHQGLALDEEMLARGAASTTGRAERERDGDGR